MNTTMADGAEQRLDAQIAEALFGQPGMSKMDVANRVRELRGDGPALLGPREPGQDERARFEAWAKARYGSKCELRGNGDYYIAAVQNMWVGWQAARSAQPQYITDAYELGMRDGQALSAQPSPGGQGDARAAFKTWAVSEGLSVEHDEGRFHGLETRGAWLAWKHIAARQPVTMDDALAAGDGTLHGAIDHWQERALRAEAELAARQPVGISADWVLGYLTTDAPEESREAIRNAFTEYAALSGARQPAGQEPAFYLSKADADYIAARTSNANQVVAIREPRSKSAVPFYAAPPAQAVDLEQTFQAGVAEWMGQCFLPSLYSNMTERGDRLLEEVLELLQAHGYDPARVPKLVDYVFSRPVGEPAQEVGGVMVTLAGYCWVAGLDMHAAGDAELARINQPEVMAKIRAKQEAKNALHFDTPLPGNAAEPARAVDLGADRFRDPDHLAEWLGSLVDGSEQEEWDAAQAAMIGVRAFQHHSAVIERLREAVEGECDGLAITTEQAAAIFDHVLEPSPLIDGKAVGK